MSGDVLDLSIGSPGYEPPEQARVAAVRAIGRGLGGYAPMGGLRRLRTALATKLSERNDLDASADEVAVTSGASAGIFAAMSALCRPGDLVLVPDPCFPLYRLAARTLGLRVASYPITRVTGPHQPDWETLARLMPAARLLLWNYPSNPLGVTARPEWSARMFDLMRRSPGLIVLSDEVYEDLSFEGPHVTLAASAADVAGRIVSVYSFSKGYGMAAWRVGYLHATAEIVAQVERAHWGATMSTSSTGQIAALAALAAPGDYLDERRAFVRSHRDLAVSGLRAAGLGCATPQGGFFAWVDIAGCGLSAPEFTERCAGEIGVLLSPGDDFGVAGRRHVRLNYAVPPPRLMTALDLLATWVRTLRRTTDKTPVEISDAR